VERFNGTISYSYKASSIPDAKIWEVTLAMCHTSGTKNLLKPFINQPAVNTILHKQGLSSMLMLHKPCPAAIWPGRVKDLLAS
jgi:hypothetical protein